MALFDFVTNNFRKAKDDLVKSRFNLADQTRSAIALSKPKVKEAFSPQRLINTVKSTRDLNVVKAPSFPKTRQQVIPAALQGGGYFAQEMLNTFSRAGKGVANIGEDAMNKRLTPTRTIANIAPLGEAFLTVGTGGGSKVATSIAKEAFKQGSKRTALQVLKRGAAQGAVAGGGSGLLHGLTQNGDSSNVFQQFIRSTPSAGAGAIFGGALGGGLAMPGATKSALSNMLVKKHKISSEVANKAVDNYVRNKFGQFAGKLKVKGKGNFPLRELQVPFGSRPVKSNQQAEINKRLGRDPETQLYFDDLERAMSNFKNKAETKVGLQVRDINKDHVSQNVLRSQDFVRELGKKNTDEILGPPDKVSMLRRGIDRSRNVIASQGAAGKELAGKIHESREIAEVTAGKWISKLPTVSKLSKKEFVDFVDAAEGKTTPTSEKVNKAVGEWAEVREEVFGKAKEAGVDIGRLEDYFPHHFDENMFSDRKQWRSMIQHLVDTGQATDPQDAAQKLRFAQDTVRNRRQGNLEISRIVDLPNYEKTKEALYKYLESSGRRIGDVDQFGPKDEKALTLINQIANEGGDADTVKNQFDLSVGAKKYDESAKKISGVLRGAMSTSKLGLGAITNTGQTVNTATVTGALRTMLSAPKAAFSKEAKDFALQSGITLDGVINDVKEGTGFSGKVMGKITAPGFSTVEKFNRTLAAWSGKGYAENLAKNAGKGKGYAIKQLNKMGLNGEDIAKRGKLTEDETVRAARNIVERTQFKVDPQDLPGWTASPWGKLLTQFKSFAYNQTAFMEREILEPAVKGNISPLVRFLAIGIPTGAAIGETRRVLQFRDKEEDPKKRILNAFNQVGGTGLAGDVYRGFFPSGRENLTADRRVTLALGSLTGPTVGTAIEGLGSAAQASYGDTESLKRFAVRQTPIIGTSLQNKFLPYKSMSTVRAEKQYNALKAVPQEQRAKEMRLLKEKSPTQYRYLVQLIEDKQIGLERKDQKLRGLGVEDGSRAKAVRKALDNIDDPTEKQAYYKKLRQAGVITDDVYKQLKELKRGEL